ncbi:hypothetical protein NXC14_CH02320 [Rhizobium sp. NXC14]|nr:hypothetical protein NXC14_CH02320 [Rhizobium sp. NXC14]
MPRLPFSFSCPAPQRSAPPTKCLPRESQVLDLAPIGLVPDNIGAMSLGKARDGTDVLILRSDNNFSTSQKSQFYAFKVLRRSQQ